MDKKFTFHALDWWIRNAHELNIVFLYRNFHLITDKDVKQNVTWKQKNIHELKKNVQR